MNPDPQQWDAWMAHVARAAASIQHLPAIACADWGDRGAERLGALPGVFGAAVLVGRGLRVGDPVRLDAVGVRPASPAAGGERMSDSEALGVRARLESLAASGALRLGESTGGAEAAWGDRGLSVVQSWARVGGGERVLITMLALRGGEPERRERITSALEALTPLLAHRAHLALGDGGGEPVWLTSREQLVLDQLILGRSVREIAELIERSPHTVHDHVKNLHRKLGASSRGALIARALGRGGSEAAGDPRPGGAPEREGLLGADREFEPKPISTLVGREPG